MVGNSATFTMKGRTNMDTVLNLLVEWWPLVVLIAAVLAKVANKLTPHFEDKAGLLKALLIAVDLLDLVKTSRPLTTVKK